jgi:hypothetical protein
MHGGTLGIRGEDVTGIRIRIGGLCAALSIAWGVFAQSDPLGGAWKSAELRLTLKPGSQAGTYGGSLEFDGKTYPIFGRSNAASSSLSGEFTADGASFPFTARIDAARLRFVTDGTEYLLAREASDYPMARNQSYAAQAAATPAIGSPAARHRHPGGLSLTPPAGWKVQDGPQGVVLLPPGVTFDPKRLDELYVATSQPGSATDPKFAEELSQGLGQQGGRLNQSTIQIAGRQAVVYSGQAKHPEQNLMMGIKIYLLQDGPNVNAVLGIGAVDRVEGNDAGLRQVAGSLSFQAAAAPQAPPLPPAGALSDGSSVTVPWVQKLRGQKLQQITTGNYDAGRSVWILKADGAFTYSSNYSGAVYAPGGANASVGRLAKGDGRWRIVSRGGGAVLELKFSNGEQREYNLTANGSQTFMNGRRTYVTDPSEGN